MTRHSARCWALWLGVLLAAALPLLAPIRPPAYSPGLICSWRVPVRGIVSSSRRNYLDSPSPCIMRRSQRVDLGYDFRALALQHGKPGHEFRNSGIHLRHREDWHALEQQP
jgi:hypothetical protein